MSKNKVVDDIVYALGGDSCGMTAVVIENISIDERLVLVIIATDSRRHRMRQIVVQVVIAKDITRPRPGYIDAVSIRE